ncbi:MAG: mechanosensitive ion channel family protein, partial [Oscillospiraceae bacterium]
DQIWDYISKPMFLLSVAVVVGAFALWLALRQGHKKYVAAGKAKGEKATLVRVMFGILQFLIMLGAVVIILQMNGVNINSVVAGLGLLSAIVGFSLQDVLKDIAMGIHIISNHFFSVGDVVSYQDIEGEVISFTINTTTIRNIYDQTITTICNRNISEITKMQKSAQVDIDLPLSYKESIKKVHTVLADICEQIGKLEGIDRCIYKGTQSFDDSAVIYKLRFFCPPGDKPERTRDAMRVIQNGLDAADIHIAYRQLDVHTSQQ